MICRKWDVANTYRRYRSTEYILSNVQGNAIQCSARSNISQCFISKLEERKVLSIANFSVVANKYKYRIRNSDAYVIELEGYTIVKKPDCSIGGFVRFPFQLIKLDEIQANDSTYLIGKLSPICYSLHVLCLGLTCFSPCNRCWNREDRKVRVRTP